MTTSEEEEYELDVVVPEQLVTTTPSLILRRSPAARMWLSAVLWAVREAGGSNRRVSTEAMAWLVGNERNVGSFFWIAEHLHVAAEPWRRRLLAMVESKACR